MTEEFDLDLDSVLSEEEEIGTQHNARLESNRVDYNTAAEAELYKQKLTKMEQEFAAVKQQLESGNKTNFVDHIFQKYSDIDPSYKNMAVEMLQGYNQLTQLEMKKIHEVFDSLQKDLIATRKAVDEVGSHVSSVQSGYAFDTLIRDTLERGFKDKDIKTRHVNDAKKLHFKKMDKDEAYALKILNIIDNKNYTIDKKDKMVAQIILEEYHTAAIKKAKEGKLSKTDLTPRKTIKATEESNEIKEEIKQVQEESENPGTKEETKVDSERLKKEFMKRLNI
jgi:hypothetical protein